MLVRRTFSSFAETFVCYHRYIFKFHLHFTRWCRHTFTACWDKIITLLQTVRRVSQWKNFKNWSIIWPSGQKKSAAFLGAPLMSTIWHPVRNAIAQNFIHSCCLRAAVKKHKQTQNLELPNSSNSSMSNLGYLQTSLKDPLHSVSLFCHLASIILCALILSQIMALYKSFTYLFYLLLTNFIFIHLKLRNRHCILMTKMHQRSVAYIYNRWTQFSDEPMHKVSGAIDGVNHPHRIITKFKFCIIACWFLTYEPVRKINATNASTLRP